MVPPVKSVQEVWPILVVGVALVKYVHTYFTYIYMFTSSLHHQGSEEKDGSGKCSCDKGYEGETCQVCSKGYFNDTDEEGEKLTCEGTAM